MLTTPLGGYTYYSNGKGCAVCYLECDNGYEPNTGSGYTASSCKKCQNWDNYLETCPSGFRCDSHWCQTVERFSKTGCERDDYYFENGNCKECTWPNAAKGWCDFKDRDGKCTEIKCGRTTQYVANDCIDEYKLVDGVCEKCDWDGYTLTSCPSNGGCVISLCGNVQKYKLNSCNSGYKISTDGNSCLKDIGGLIPDVDKEELDPSCPYLTIEMAHTICHPDYGARKCTTSAGITGYVCCTASTDLQHQCYKTNDLH